MSAAPLLTSRGEAARQQLYGALGSVSTSAVRLLSALLAGRPRPRATLLPKRRVGDGARSSSPEELDAALRELSAAAPRWAETPFKQRAELARACARRARDCAEAMTAAAVAVKGSYTTGDGEERAVWAAAPLLLNDLAVTLDGLARGRARAPAALLRRAGRTAVRVFPSSLYDHLLFSGYSGELYLAPGEAPSAGGEARQGGPPECCLVLGAGNQAVVAVADVAHYALVRGCVCILAINPVCEYAADSVEHALAPLVAAGALRFAYGGVETGRYLCSHSAVHSVHITGSDRTYDAIVWGGAAKQAGAPPPFAKPISAELGCVTPLLMVPGVWTEADLEHKAAEVVAATAHNASCNCLAAKVVLLCSSWPQREAFLAALRRAFQAAPPRACYYPGSRAKYDAFLAAYPAAQQLGDTGGDDSRLPWLLLPPAPAAAGDKGLCDEAWSPVLAVRLVEAPHDDVPAFLRAAQATMNERCWGTLSCSVYVHPETQAAHAEAFESFLLGLRYGSVGVNAPTLLNYFIPSLSWGAFPGHTPDDIRSGVGVIHNSWLVDGVEKSVLRAPWRPAVTPFWHTTHGNMGALSRAIVEHMVQPRLATLLRIVAAAVRG